MPAVGFTVRVSAYLQHHQQLRVSEKPRPP
jgi:hypothetical protein